MSFQAQAFQAGESEQGAIDLSALDFFQSGLDIAGSSTVFMSGANV